VNELLEHFERDIIIVSMRGLGGIGKTALSYKLAEKLLGRYPDGQLMVNLQGTDANPVKPTEATWSSRHLSNLVSEVTRTA
jgi:hypothetical protein